MCQFDSKLKISILCLLTIYRLTCFLLTRNYEYPDQYWQGPEVAHYLHYGYGYLTWEWKLQTPIRNPLYPYLLSLPYFIGDLIKIPGHILYLLPQLLFQVPLTIISDYFMLKILKYIYSQLNIWMLVVLFGNWAYCATMVRTYANSFETCVTIISFYFWFTNGRNGNEGYKDVYNRALAIVAYVARPTSIMIWAILWPYQLYEIVKIHSLFSSKSISFVWKNIKTILLMVAFSFVVGSVFNGKATLTQLSFIKYNFIQKWSELYGKQPIYFYILLSVPFMVGFGVVAAIDMLIFVIKSAISQERNKGREQIKETEQQRQRYEKQIKKQNQVNANLKLITLFSLAYLLISSLSAHKQHRFVLPIIPFVLIISIFPFAYPTGFKFFSFVPVKLIAFFMIFTNLFTFGTFICWGKSDGFSPWNYIRQSMDEHHFESNETIVAVLGQSHFIQGYSALHRNITYKIPDSSAIKMALNQSQNKLLWQNAYQLYQILTQKGSLKPTFIIAQGKHLNHTAQVLATHGYRETQFWRHCTIIQQIFIGFDSISVFEPISRQSSRNISKKNLSHSKLKE